MLTLRVSAQYLHELLELVRVEGLNASRGAEFAADPILDIVSVVLGSGGMAAIASVVKTFLTRHKDKYVKFGSTGELLEARGFSAEDVQRVLAHTADEQHRHEEAMRRLGIAVDGRGTGNQKN